MTIRSPGLADPLNVGVALFAVDLFAVDLFAVVLFAVVLFAVVLFAVVLFAVVLFAVVLFAGIVHLSPWDAQPTHHVHGPFRDKPRGTR